MPAHDKNAAPKKRPRAPAGKKQVLILMDAEVIKRVKIAAIEDGKKMSHVVEEASREWLARHKGWKGV
jgi:hypothetical protein